MASIHTMASAKTREKAIKRTEQHILDISRWGSGSDLPACLGGHKSDYLEAERKRLDKLRSLRFLL